MRIAVFSDIHSNLEALEAFIEHSFRKRVDLYMCLGDIVGYGANPNSCINLVQTIPSIHFALGNHDSAAVGGTNYMCGEALQSISWTKMRLSEENLDFIKNLPANIQRENMLFCHANPSVTLDWYYISEKPAISRTFFLSRAKIIFAGHTHLPSIITRKNFLCVYIRNPGDGSVVPVASLNRQIFNCGSIGQPRDGDPRASYLIYDTEKNVVEFHRIAYDHELAARKILAAGLPEVLALRLATGE